MSKKGIEFDTTLWKKRSKDVIKILKIDEPKFVKEQAGLLAELATKITPPFKEFPKFEKGGYATKGAKGAGDKATRAGFYSAVKNIGKESTWKNKDIRLAIRRGDTAYLEGRLKYVKGGKKKDLDVHFYSDNRRNKKRNNRGRVNKGTQPFVGLKDSDVKAGLKRALGNVGISKASLAKIAVKLGRKNPPDWIKRHFGRVSHSMTVTKNPSVIRFKTSAPGLDVVARNLRRIERFRMIAMEKRLESLVRAAAKKSGFKVKR